MQDERVRELIEAATEVTSTLEASVEIGIIELGGSLANGPSRVHAAIAALSSPAEIRKGDDWKSLSVTAIAAENTSVAEYVGSLEARIAELEATLRSAQ